MNTLLNARDMRTISNHTAAQPAPVCAACSKELGRVDPPETSHNLCRRHLAAELARFQRQRSAPQPKGQENDSDARCWNCGKPATCFGQYEDMEAGYACDDCCGHGCEDGSCVTVAVHLNEKLTQDARR